MRNNPADILAAFKTMSTLMLGGETIEKRRAGWSAVMTPLSEFAEAEGGKGAGAAPGLRSLMSPYLRLRAYGAPLLNEVRPAA